MSVQLHIGTLIVLFAAGVIARRRGWIAPPQAAKMVQLVVFVGLPALFLASVSRMPLDRELLALPAIAIIVVLATLLVARAVGRRMVLPRASLGAFVVSSMSINTAVLLPFVIVPWGQQAVSELALFDLGYSLVEATVLCGVAARYGGRSTGALAPLRGALSFPPLWALVVALCINLAGVDLPAGLTTALDLIGRTIVLLVLVAMGVLFDGRLWRSAGVIGVLVLRILFGLFVGYACVEAFGLTGLERATVLLGSAAPIGFTAVVLASREHLDRELAASAASLSILFAMLYTPVALWMFDVSQNSM